jgi:hypothetical protein
MVIGGGRKDEVGDRGGGRGSGLVETDEGRPIGTMAAYGSRGSKGFASSWEFHFVVVIKAAEIAKGKVLYHDCREVASFRALFQPFNFQF